jgi:hypothetical protein
MSILRDCGLDSWRREGLAHHTGRVSEFIAHFGGGLIYFYMSLFAVSTTMPRLVVSSSFHLIGHCVEQYCTRSAYTSDYAKAVLQ